jgi:hypothetical protein
MNHLKEEKLCARLTGKVGKMSADTFYKKFNLLVGTNSVYSEFFFKEMLQIFALPGMER